MTTDIEHELRELFRERALEAPTETPAVTAAVLRRGRRRQVVTVAGSAAIAFAIAAGSVAGLGALLRGPGVSPDVGSASPTVEAPRSGTVDLEGTFRGAPWSVRFSGSFADTTACIETTIDDRGFDPLCLKRLRLSLAGAGPSLHSWLTRDAYVLAGSVPPDIAQVAFVGDDGTTFPASPCRLGPSGWTDPDKAVCAIALPPQGIGTLRYLDAAGDVVSKESIAWHTAAEESNEYAWTNENGTITASGVYEGVGWTLQVLYYADGYVLDIDGRTALEGVLPLDDALVFATSPTGSDADANAIALVLTGTDVESVAVTPDGGGDAIEGRWVPGSTADGGEARLWMIELPGHGSGTVLLDDIASGTVCWPTDCS
jgi:hypothetical protein